MSAASLVLNSSKKHNWRTPKKFLELLKPFGPIVFDPYTDADNPVGAKWFRTETNKDLIVAADWWCCEGLVFANPPYGHALGPCWREIALAGSIIGSRYSGRAHDKTEMITLTPLRPDTGWCRDEMFCADVVCALKWRPQFLEQRADGSWGPTISKNGSPCGIAVSMGVTYWGRRPQFFKEVFADQGMFLKRDL